MTTLTKLPEKQHSMLAPSAAHRWMNCVPSLDYEYLKEFEEVSEFALEGTRAHKLMEDVLSNYDNAAERNKILAACDDVEMREHIAELYTTFDALIKRIGKHNIKEILIESKVQFSNLIYGTIDIAILYTLMGEKRIYVLDLKYGRGVAVAAAENPQLIIYALAAEKTYAWPWKRATIAIYQPRNKTDAGALDQWVMTEELKDTWTKRITEIEKVCVDYSSSLAPKTIERTAGDWCRWCPGKALCRVCAAHASAPGMIELLSANALPIVPKPQFNAEQPDMRKIVSDLTYAQQHEILTKRHLIVEFIEALEAHVIQGLKCTKTGYPDWKLVAGKGKSRWKDGKHEQIAAVLQKAGIESPWTKKLLGISEARALLGKKVNINGLIERSKPRTILAPISDLREDLYSETLLDLLAKSTAAKEEEPVPVLDAAVEERKQGEEKPKRKVWRRVDG